MKRQPPPDRVQNSVAYLKGRTETTRVQAAREILPDHWAISSPDREQLIEIIVVMLEAIIPKTGPSNPKMPLSMVRGWPFAPGTLEQ